MIYTKHARVRAQQRGIPPLIGDWLEQYGEETYNGEGTVTRWFSRASLRRMERDLGRAVLTRMGDWLQAYRVESSRDGVVITVGKRYRRLRRR